MNNKQRTIEWAKAKGLLDDPKPLKQLEKVASEVIELTVEVSTDVWVCGTGVISQAAFPSNNARLELGDCLVTLHVLAAQLGVDPDECHAMALDKIENRSGKMVDGLFVKDGD